MAPQSPAHSPLIRSLEKPTGASQWTERPSSATRAPRSHRTATFYGRVLNLSARAAPILQSVGPSYRLQQIQPFSSHPSPIAWDVFRLWNTSRRAILLPFLSHQVR